MPNFLGFTIVGIDPGLHRTGYAFIEVKEGKCKIRDIGVIATSKAGIIGQRILFLAEEMKRLLDLHRPQYFVIEKIYSHVKHPYTSVLMAHARGALLLCAAERDINIENMPASRIKKAITGNGNAGKEQVRSVLAQIFNDNSINKLSLDASDALALAVGFVFLKGKDLF